MLAQEHEPIIILDEIGTPMVYVPARTFEWGYSLEGFTEICLELRTETTPESLCSDDFIWLGI